MSVSRAIGPVPGGLAAADPRSWHPGTSRHDLNAGGGAAVPASTGKAVA